MDIGVLIGIIISIVIGVSMIPVITSTVNSLDTENMSSATVSLVKIVPIVVVVVMILGVVAYVTQSGFGEYSSSSSSKEKKKVNISKSTYLPWENVSLSKINKADNKKDKIIEKDIEIEKDIKTVVEEEKDPIIKQQISDIMSLKDKMGEGTGAIKKNRL